jgi:Zn finger protein HypA/HybF involved in hydrogenase expression
MKMIEKPEPVKVVKVKCMECGMIVPLVDDGRKLLACPKCGGKEFEINSKTEVITK